jgi:hypothetical protein
MNYTIVRCLFYLTILGPPPNTGTGYYPRLWGPTKIYNNAI